MAFSRKTSLLSLSTIIALIGILSVTEPLNAQRRTQRRSEELLPSSTRAWFSVPNMKALTDGFQQCQIGKLSNDDALKPFFDSFEKQARRWLDEKNIKHGIQLADLETFQTGEICIAGVLPRNPSGDGVRDKHGLVLLVDVTDSKKEAEQLLIDVGKKLKEKGATSRIEEPSGVVTTVWETEFKKIKRKQSAYHAIVENWLVSSDNAEVFKEIIRRIKRIETDDASTLAFSSNLSRHSQKLFV